MKRRTSLIFRRKGLGRFSSNALSVCLYGKCVCFCACACVCVREREREKKRGSERVREREEECQFEQANKKLRPM